MINIKDYPIDEALFYTHRLARGFAWIFLVTGVAIVPLTAILHPAELTSNSTEITLGILLMLSLSACLFYATKLLRRLQNTE